MYDMLSNDATYECAIVGEYLVGKEVKKDEPATV